MGQFHYKAVNQSGGHISGAIEAVDRRSAVTALTGQGHFVTELAEGPAPQGANSSDETTSLDVGKLVKFRKGKVSTKDVLAFTTQLGTALRAGLPLMRGLELIRNQQHKPATKELLGDLVDAVNTGKSLSEAMAGHEDIFSPLYLSMIRVGETGGMLEQTTAQLADMLSREEKIKSNMRNASAYPLFVLTLGLVSVTIIITVILPRIMSTLGADTATLPMPTRALLGISVFVKGMFTTLGGWAFIVAVIAGLFYFKRWKKGPGRLKFDAFKLRIPILGSVLRTIAVGRFARTLGSLTMGGVTILDALAVVRDTLGNELLGREVDTVADKVKRGESLAEPLEESGYFPPLLVQIVSVGEQTGKLDELLLNAADTFDAEADSAVSKFMAIFPAILILVLALVIGFIIAATLLPIVAMQSGGGTL